MAIGIAGDLERFANSAGEQLLNRQPYLFEKHYQWESSNETEQIRCDRHKPSRSFARRLKKS